MDPKDKFKEMQGGHVAADEDADRAVPVGQEDTSGPYVPHIPGFSPGISHGDDIGDMGPRSGVNASTNAGAPGSPECQPGVEPPAPPVGLGVGEGDRGLAGGGGLTATPTVPRRRK